MPEAVGLAIEELLLAEVFCVRVCVLMHILHVDVLESVTSTPCFVCSAGIVVSCILPLLTYVFG